MDEKIAGSIKELCEEFARRLFTLASGNFTGKVWLNVTFSQGGVQNERFGTVGKMIPLHKKEK